MKKGYLSEYFKGVGVKVLSAVDANPKKSNQHEIGTTKKMRKFLGNNRHKFEASYVWLGEEQESITDFGTATHYDAREKKNHRSAEFRLYYLTNNVTELMTEGDTLFLAMRPDRSLLFIIVPSESSLHGQLLWLFDIDTVPQPGKRFITQQYTDNNDSKIDFISRFILDLIGIEYEDPNSNSLDSIIDKYIIAEYGLKFPTTAVFSNLARITLPEVNPESDPDAALLTWLNHEEALFRRLENQMVARRISKGFENEDGIDVDGFIKYSLRVQNRRKSRMGHSLEHHLKAIFEAKKLKFDSQVITEKNKKPDFIFPGREQYYDQDFSVKLLTVLAAKSTCKDRWPQILPEAERIPQKHLITIEPGISVSQTEMMKESNVQLIVPLHIQDSYQSSQKKWLYSVNDFIGLVSQKQKSIHL